MRVGSALQEHRQSCSWFTPQQGWIRDQESLFYVPGILFYTVSAFLVHAPSFVGLSKNLLEGQHCGVWTPWPGWEGQPAYLPPPKNMIKKLVMDSGWEKSHQCEWMSVTAETFQSWSRKLLFHLKGSLFRQSPKIQGWCFVGHLGFYYFEIGWKCFKLIEASKYLWKADICL